MNFGDELKKLRKTKGLSIRKTGELAGISHAYLSQIESGKRPKPKPDIIKKLSQALGESYIDLMDKAGYLEDLSYREKEFLKTNEDFQKHLSEKLDAVLKKISVNNEFLPALQDEIWIIQGHFENLLDEEFSPNYLRKLISEAEWDQEWLLDLVRILEDIAEKYPAIKDLAEFLSKPDVSYKKRVLTENDRKRILDMLNVLFPEK